MKWELSVPRPATLVYYYVKLIGLAPFTMKENRFHPPSLLDKLVPVFSAGTYLCLTTIRVVSQFEVFRGLENVLEFVVAVSTIQSSINCLTTFVTPLMTLWKYDKILNAMNKFCDIGDKIERLGIEEDRGKFFKDILVTVTTTNVVYIATFAMLSLIEARSDIFATMGYSVEFWFYINVVVTFTRILFLIRQRFQLINEELCKAIRPADRRRFRDVSRIFVVCGNPRGETRPTDFERIQTIELLHLELCGLVDVTTDLFAIPILLRSAALCTELILNCFWIYFVVLDSGKFDSTAEIVLCTMKISVASFKIVVSLAQLIAVAYASAKTCQEGNTTRTLLSKVRYDFQSQELKDEFFLFSLQLTHGPVATSLCGFFDLGYSYVYQVLCAVTAYLIILIQFDLSKPYHGH